MVTSTGHTSAIRAKKVIGTPVKDKSGGKIGHVEDIVLDKLNNHVMFAVVSFGGFLGVGEKYHPMPWSALDYDEHEHAYVVDYSKDQLQAAPSDSLEALTKDDGQRFRDRAFDYYNTPHDW
jgi:sporulation protein YlmC with PRC-barrel domain